MMKIFYLITTAIIVLTNSSCSWATDKKYTINDVSVCELSLGQSENLLKDSFEKLTIHTESGESYKFRGKLCDGKILVEVETKNYAVSKISILALDFCNNEVCIGMSFEEVRNLLPNTNLFFSGEEGGIISLEDLNGIRYEFSTEGISIDCYVNKDNCIDKLRKSKLTSIII